MRKLTNGVRETGRYVKETFLANPERWILFLVGIGGALWLYIMYGSDSDIGNEGRSIFRWFVISWGKGEDYTHCRWMLIFAGLVVWLKRRELARTEATYSLLGALGVAGFLLAHVVGYSAQLPRLSLGTSIAVAWCMVWAVWGWKIAKVLWFPAAYILLCFLGSMLMDVTMSLRLVSSRWAVGLLYVFGVDAVNYGTVVMSAAKGGHPFQFDIAEVCSGLRTLLVMTALAAPYACFVMRCGFWRKITLFAMSVPLSILTNALRIFTLGLVAKWFGQEVAMKRYHDMAGFIVLIIAITLLTATGDLLQRDWKKTLCQIKLKKIKKLPKSSRD